MAPKNRIIIDTDPGVDDILAILMALAATSSDLEVLLISVSFGNIDVRSCLRNVVATFHILEQEIRWREQHKLPIGFEGIRNYKPIVAIGAAEPLQDRIESADYFHGRDGLGGITESHPQFSPEESWAKLFERPPPDSIITKAAKPEVDIEKPVRCFTASTEPAHKEILRLLRENEPGTITLISIGPLTTMATAAAEDPETFLRCKELITMGGAVEGSGNVTPVAEFNVFADPYAAARVYALSSPQPSSTMPVAIQGEKSAKMNPYPPKLSKQLTTRLMSLDITELHTVSRGQFNARMKGFEKEGSPLVQWMQAFMEPIFKRMEKLHVGHEGEGAALALHDPLCIWYVLTQGDSRWKPSQTSPEDVRVETRGQWTRGQTVGDMRNRKRRDSDGEAPHDRGNWLGNHAGNRIYRMMESPGRHAAGEFLLDILFGKNPPL